MKYKIYEPDLSKIKRMEWSGVRYLTFWERIVLNVLYYFSIIIMKEILRQESKL